MRIAFLETPATDGWSDGHARFQTAAGLLADRGHEVLIVRSTSGGGGGANHPGVTHVPFDRGQLPVLTALNRDIGAGPMIESNLVAHRLADLKLKPDIVIAPLRGGLAQGVLTARACGEAFEATRVALWCNSPSQPRFLHSDGLDSGIAPMVADALEKQSLALTDALILPDGEKVETFLRLAGRTLPYFVAALPADLTAIAAHPPLGRAAINEIVFVGPLRRAAGVAEFIHAIERLAKVGLLTNRSVTFLGPSQAHSPGIGKAWLGRRATGWPFRFRVIDEANRVLAWQYISRRGRLAVSIADDADELHFLQGCSGPHLGLQRDPNGRDDLACRIETALRAALEGRRTMEQPRAVTSDWSALAPAIHALPLPAAPLPPPRPGVTVCVLHHDRLGKLAELLSSIPLDVDGDPVEVIVVDNASTIAGVRDEILAISGSRPRLRVIELGDPVPPTTAHNLGVVEARFETVLLADDDNIFVSDGVQRLTRAVARGGFDIVVSALDIFDDGTSFPYPTVGRLIFLGAAHSAGLFFNAFGDTAMAVRRDRFLSLGGFHDPGHDYPCRDWVTLAKAQAGGHRIGALQWPAVRYRRDTAYASISANKLDQEGARSFVFNVYGDAYDADLVARYAQNLYLSEM